MGWTASRASDVMLSRRDQERPHLSLTVHGAGLQRRTTAISHVQQSIRLAFAQKTHFLHTVQFTPENLQKQEQNIIELFADCEHTNQEYPAQQATARFLQGRDVSHDLQPLSGLSNTATLNAGQRAACDFHRLCEDRQLAPQSFSLHIQSDSWILALPFFFGPPPAACHQRSAPGRDFRRLFQMMQHLLEVCSRAKGIGTLWCNARESALSFYRQLGFTVFSDRFF